MTCVLFLPWISCSSARYIPEGDYLYVKGEVEVQSDTIAAQYIQPLTEALEELLRPKPNSSFLGMRPQLAIFNRIDSPRRENSIKGWLKYRVGEAPVLLSDVNREYNQNLLRNRLENLGFFNAEVQSDTTLDKHKATVSYTAIPGIIHRISSVTFEMDSTELGRAIMGTAESSLLQEGRPFNLATIIEERERIDNELKNLGYYYFNPDYLLVEVDSSRVEHQVDLYVTVKREAPPRAKQPYRIRNIVIYPDYNASQQTRTSTRLPRNAELFRDQYYIIDPENTYRRFALANTMFFERGEYYNRTDHTRTLNQLVNMGTFRLVKNDFIDVDTGGNLLDVHYYLTPKPKRGLRIELLGKTASVYNGSEINVNWLNRNTFRSGELLTLSVFGGFETQTGGNVNLNSSFRRYGAELALTFPRLIAPFRWEASRRYTPRTYFRTGYEFLSRRSAYTLNSLSFSTGYQWRETVYKEHELAIFEVGYVQPSRISESYRRQMDTIPALQYTVEPQFTFGPVYKFTYTNTMDAQKKHTYYFRGGLDLSANTYGLIRGSNYKEGRVDQIFNADFSQYVKTEADFRHYLRLGANRTLASRAMLGLGISYGNSSKLPYVKQFFAGGPNSLKAFRARAVGPGTFQPQYLDEDNFFADQTGDIKIELNTEYRDRLTGILHWAVFVDAGNIWIQHPDPEKPGAHFSRDFWKEFAVGGGAGLRFDLSFLILRTDLAIPFRVPYHTAGERWVFSEIDFGNRDWRRQNLIFNLAIGYPF